MEAAMEAVDEMLKKVSTRETYRIAYQYYQFYLCHVDNQGGSSRH